MFFLSDYCKAFELIYLRKCGEILKRDWYLFIICEYKVVWHPF